MLLIVGPVVESRADTTRKGRKAALLFFLPPPARSRGWTAAKRETRARLRRAGRLTRIPHQSATAAVDAQHPAALSPLGVLNVPPGTPPLASGRNPHWAQRLDALATRTDEVSGSSPGKTARGKACAGGSLLGPPTVTRRAPSLADNARYRRLPSSGPPWAKAFT